MNADASSAAGPRPHWLDVLTPGERRELLATNNWRGWLSIALNWGLIAASMALVALYPNVVTVLLALAVIGTRQLGMAVLMHEASHFTLLANRRLNDFAANWLCAYPVLIDVHPYRQYHLQHHARNWTAVVQHSPFRTEAQAFSLGYVKC